jgi:uncharacterized membrane protein YedE/YeeE
MKGGIHLKHIKPIERRGIMSTETIRQKQKQVVSFLPSPKKALISIGAAVGIILAASVYIEAGFNQTVLYVLGLLLGVTLFHARFGFTSAFRRLLAVGNGQAIEAHMIMLSAASVLFAIILSTGAGFSGAAPEGNVSPIGVGMLFGAFLFGIGMQLGSGCASGTLYQMSGGNSSMVITLFFFIIGSVIAASHLDFWVNGLPALPAISLADTGLGYFGALVVQLIVFAGIFSFVRWFAKKKKAPRMKEVPAERGWKRVVRGSWPLWTGALVLAILNTFTLLFKGSPWGITSGFTLWGAKAAQALGIDVSSWTYFSGANGEALQQSVLLDSTSVMNFGIIIGAFLASAAGGVFAIKKLRFKVFLSSMIGGLLMGYGARLAYGCNIGAYFSGIASFSLHGWAWAIMALFGSWVALYLRPLFGLSVPKRSDHFC